MCGICGFVSLRSRYSEESLKRMSCVLGHRGPDDEGLYLAEIGRAEFGESLSEGNIGLAHRRLSIIDLTEAGRQPMSNEDGKIRVVFNGEIYNFKDLRCRLESLHHRFRSRTDTEVLVHGYEEWGDGLLKELNGMFAVAIWDGERERLLLARDRLGIKPLYVYRHDGDLLFASELGALRVHPAFNEVIDRHALEQYLSFSYVPTPRSIFECTEKVPPGYCLVWERGDVHRQRFWEVPDLAGLHHDAGREWRTSRALRSNIEFRGSLEKALDELEWLIDDSVCRRMMSDVPLGAFLSGGIDSSLVVALMCRHSSRRVKTFSIGFSERGFDESHYASTVAAHLGTDHTGYILEPGDTRRMILEASHNFDEPIGDPSAIPTYLVSSLSRRSGMKVALSGDGGDELFCGYQRYRRMEPLLRFDSWPVPLRKGLFTVLASVLPGRLGRISSQLVYDEYAEIYRARMSGWKQGDIDVFTHKPDAGLFHDTLFWKVARTSSKLPPLERLALIDLKTYLVDDVLTKVDRMSMAVSLEVRVPLLDHRIVEFARRLPLRYKFRRGVLKYILRRLAWRFVPRELLERPKSGFAIPVERWLQRDLNDLLHLYLAPETVGRWGLFDPDKVSGAVAGFEKDQLRNSRFMWGLLMFAIWMEGRGPGRFKPSELIKCAESK